jgi:hypothetical protein
MEQSKAEYEGHCDEEIYCTQVDVGDNSGSSVRVMKYKVYHDESKNKMWVLQKHTKGL